MRSLAGGEIGQALTAMALHTSSNPGSSWRVGAGRLEEADAEAAAQPVAGGAQAIFVQAGRQAGKVKAAVMTIAPASSGDAKAAVAAAALDGAHDEGDSTDGTPHASAVVVELWRADMLSSVLELGPGCSIQRADPAAGLLFGVPPSVLAQHHLYK